MSVISLSDLHKHFGKIKAVDGISFQVEKGEIFGFLGPNGAGKTTTIRCMMDYIRPTKGEISILDKNAQKESVALKHQVGYLSGTVRLYDKWTGKTHIDFFSKLNGKTNVADQLVKRLDFDTSLKAKKLSSGNRQKLGIILAMMNEPDVLIFDEPTNALDPILQNEVYDLLEEARARGATIFMSSHNLREVERVCDRIGIIKQGKMVAVESVSSIKEKLMYTVRLFSKQELPQSDFQGDGISSVQQITNGLEMTVKGDINPLLDKLCNYQFDDVEITHANLEDIFLEFYS